jgi:MtfA peptidase
MLQDTVWLDSRDSYTIIEKTDSTSFSSDSLMIQTILQIQTTGTPRTYSYNPKNKARTDSILKYLLLEDTSTPIKLFDEQKEYYDNLAGIIDLFIIIIAIAVGYYAYRRAEKYKNNPFDEDESDWIEIGSSPRNNYGRSYDISEMSTLWNIPEPKPVREYLIYNGSDLNFSQEQIVAVLNKRFPYFIKLGISERARFLNRHKKFMKSKSFKIHDASGFKEMPILISATAIQLSFGLEEYMLPYYQNIHIFPQKFLGMHPTMRFLEGNVSGNDINISWKHYLEGYDNTNDGQNLGLHEMAHVYYAQNFTFEGNKDKCFVNGFTEYNSCGNKVFENEKIKSGALFSNYALKNFQEFWAESVELFFEKPAEMKVQYEDLYDSMRLLLNQTPA